VKEMLPTKYKNKSELISEFVINPILQSENFLKIHVKSLKNINENAITDELVRYLKYHSKYSYLYQTHHIDVSVRPTQVNKFSINNEPDIKFLIGEVTNKIVFEAKRLNRSSSESDYCGIYGFGRFLSGYYEINEYCGMLGYMETGKTDLRIKRIQAELKNFYLFGWDKIIGKDNVGLIDVRLREYLTQKFGIDWIKTAKVEKSDNKTIRITNGKNFLSLSLNSEKTKVNLKIDDGRFDEFLAKAENNKIDIYINLDFGGFFSLFSNCFQSSHNNSKMKLKCYHLILDLK